jgi:hypothetical protein
VVDYVPTQVLTEFFLQVFDQDGSISGLIYNSAVTGRAAIVLDVPNDRCVAQHPEWLLDDRQLRLGLVSGSIHSLRVV